MIVRGTRSTSGNGTAAASPNPAEDKIKVGPFIQLQLKETGPVVVKLLLGSTEIYEIKLLSDGDGVLLSDFPVAYGVAGESLYVNLDVSKSVYYQIQVEEYQIY